MAEYRVTHKQSSTTRGETSGTVHSQTVTYDDQKDAGKRWLLADKVQVSEQQQVSDGEAEAVRKAPRVASVQFKLSFLDALIS